MTEIAARPETPAPAKDGADDEVFLVDPSIRARRRENILVAVVRVAIAVVGLLAWEFASGRIISEFWISSPSAVWAALVRFVENGQLMPAVQATVVETAVGFVVGAVAGMLVGLVFGISPLVARILDPYFTALNSIPRVALIPLFILWFGIGFETKVVFAATLVFFPVMLNTFAGARDVDRDLIDVIRVMGATRLDAVRRIFVPSALVWVFAGLRMSVPFALIGAVIAEMFTSNAGLGYLISISANQYDTGGSFAALLVTTVLGLLLTFVVSVLERRALRWRPAVD
ncbi:NitT/TauT family transport system permease protein [Pseudonocardia thermophila]|uniref:NitT/TauT family transport system permease protein n=1 Tax=Pseudonocardia thermophila TaxID=1848 RepID=A0A1M6PQG1_PSETH|nr:ABC transporter permease [Pseudonocardia thermophila]SHK10186.1 NitT/TauT family transport system permease protein [Pseudonocardia thermophila]